MNRTLFFSVLFFCFSSFLFAQNNWELLNPKPTFQDGRDIYFVSSQKGYIVNNSEILETLDAGNSWEVKQSINFANDIDFNENIGFIVGSQSKVYRTVDYGDNWSQVTTGFSGQYNSVSVISENVIVISSYNQIIKSEDGGITWEGLDVFNVNIKKSVFTSANVGHIACANGKIFKTIDGGENWNLTYTTNSSPSDFINMIFANENVGYASRMSGNIFKTIDGGETWINILNGIADIYGMQFLNENLGYVTGEYGVVYKTNNGGLSWQGIGVINGFNDDVDLNSVFFLNENDGFVTGDKGRILKTVNGGQTWTPNSFNYYDVKQIQFTSYNIGYILIGNLIYKTLDGGETWSVTNLSDTYETSKFDFVTDDIGYAIGYFGMAYKTTDGGQTWTVCRGGYPLNSDGINTLEFLDPLVGFATGGFNDRLFLKTIDGGESWNAISGYSFKQIQFFNDQVGYGTSFAMSPTNLYKTTDGGVNWDVVLNSSDDINAFHFINENVGYVTGYYGLLKKTIDGGNTWLDLDIPTEFYEVIQFYSEEIGFLVDEDGIIYGTMDSGHTWSRLFTASTISDINFFNDIAYMSGSGGKIFKNDLNILEVLDLSTDNYEIVIYPNPSNGIVQLKNPKTEIIKSISCYDIAGRIVRNIGGINNSNNVQINVSDLNSGLYFLNIIFNNGTSTTKKIIIN